MSDVAPLAAIVPSDPETDMLSDVIRVDKNGCGWARIQQGTQLLAPLDIGEFIFNAATHRKAALQPGIPPERRAYHLARAEMFLTGARVLDPAATDLAIAFAAGAA